MSNHNHERPADRGLSVGTPGSNHSDLVGELATQSAAFRTRWASHNVRFHNAGVKRFNHPAVGELDLNFNRLDLAADPG